MGSFAIEKLVGDTRSGKLVSIADEKTGKPLTIGKVVKRFQKIFGVEDMEASFIKHEAIHAATGLSITIRTCSKSMTL